MRKTERIKTERKKTFIRTRYFVFAEGNERKNGKSELNEFLFFRFL